VVRGNLRQEVTPGPEMDSQMFLEGHGFSRAVETSKARGL